MKEKWGKDARFTIYNVDERTGNWTPLFEGFNTWLDKAGLIAARAIGLGDSTYKINAMYLEYENVATPSTIVTPPTFATSDDVTYFENLSVSPHKDYLRIPLLPVSALQVIPGFEGSFAAGEGNQLEFFAQSSGTQGVNGKPFSDTVNSRVYGIALVATPVFADRTKDVVFSRAYYTTAQQKVKEPNSQIGVSYVVPFRA